MIPETTRAGREATYQELLGLARHSFLTYILESSSPVVVDDGDRKMLKLFREIDLKEQYYVERAYDLVEKCGVRADPPTYALKASNFNFLRPVKLAEHAVEQVAEEVARLVALQGKVLPADPCSKDFERLREDLVALRREAVLKISEMRAELAPPKPAAPAAPAAAAPVPPVPPAAPAPKAPA